MIFCKIGDKDLGRSSFALINCLDIEPSCQLIKLSKAHLGNFLLDG